MPYSDAFLPPSLSYSLPPPPFSPRPSSFTQSNPGFAVQGGFVPVGYDLYGQAQPQFVNAGMEGLGPGAPPPHQLVPYMQAPHLSGGGAGGVGQTDDERYGEGGVNVLY